MDLFLEWLLWYGDTTNLGDLAVYPPGPPVPLIGKTLWCTWQHASGHCCQAALPRPPVPLLGEELLRLPVRGAEVAVAVAADDSGIAGGGGGGRKVGHGGGD